MRSLHAAQYGYGPQTFVARLRADRYRTGVPLQNTTITALSRARTDDPTVTAPTALLQHERIAPRTLGSTLATATLCTVSRTWDAHWASRIERCSARVRNSQEPTTLDLEQVRCAGGWPDFPMATHGALARMAAEAVMLCDPDDSWKNLIGWHCTQHLKRLAQRATPEPASVVAALSWFDLALIVGDLRTDIAAHHPGYQLAPALAQPPTVAPNAYYEADTAIGELDRMVTRFAEQTALSSGERVALPRRTWRARLLSPSDFSSDVFDPRLELKLRTAALRVRHGGADDRAVVLTFTAPTSEPATAPLATRRLR